VWLTSIATPGPFLGPHGVYAPSQVTGAISWAGGAPFADATLTPSVEVWSNATTPTPFSLALNVYSAAGSLVATASGSGSAAAGAPGAASVTTWSPAAPLAMPGAALWHLVDAPLKPALYTLVTTLTLGGADVDSRNVTFGVRATNWNATSGFWLNGVNVKIMGTANHQDYAAVGVAVPDHLQWHRVSKLKEMGVNGWRTCVERAHWATSLTPLLRPGP
jgi:beta-galactosidase